MIIQTCPEVHPITLEETWHLQAALNPHASEKVLPLVLFPLRFLFCLLLKNNFCPQTIKVCFFCSPLNPVLIPQPYNTDKPLSKTDWLLSHSLETHHTMQRLGRITYPFSLSKKTTFPSPLVQCNTVCQWASTESWKLLLLSTETFWPGHQD